MKDTIFVLDDDENINLIVSRALSDNGYHVKSFLAGPELIDELNRSLPQLIILDLILPGMDGLDVLRKIRKVADIPIVMLTSRSEEIDRIVGLELGADDYVVKPFSVRELVARVKVILKRYAGLSPSDDSKIIIGDFIFDREAKEGIFRGKTLSLTKTEKLLLEHLLNNQNRVISKDNLIETVWGYDADTMTRTVDVHIANLRRKLARYKLMPFSIRTVHSMGYKLVLTD